jgi:RecA-family ATPase
VPYNKAVQIEFAKKLAEQAKNSLQQFQQHDDIDYSTMPDDDEFNQYEDIETESGTNRHKTTQQDDKSAFNTVSLKELLNRKYTTNWLVNGLVEHGNLGLIFGNSASGKSLITQDMCFCIAAGIDFKGRTTKRGNVLYICGEGFNGLHKRFMALSQHYECEPDRLHVSEQPAAFMDISSAAAVLDRIKEIGGVSLIVIDTFHRNMGVGDENSAKDFAQFLNNIDSFLKPTGAAILIIHHSGHDAKERSRGSSSIRAAMDVEYCVEKTDDFVRMKNTKMKDYEPPQPLSFRSASIIRES